MNHQNHIRVEKGYAAPEELAALITALLALASGKCRRTVSPPPRSTARWCSPDFYSPHSWRS
ncbi:acyl-CoA carboxylase epsilon subunit [Streptomyces sp. NPDC056480]|uniref:acyl-CoA carboxylase epsilon subunit n=1 Tax=Streptomyces sp. NPDC056480 TaxID=3345833 RepID=UPI0036783C2C